jgi:hypothetical protein
MLTGSVNAEKTGDPQTVDTLADRLCILSQAMQGEYGTQTETLSGSRLRGAIR